MALAARRRRTSLILALLLVLMSAALVSAGVRPALASTPAPNWWNGTTCDQGNYPGSYALGASYNGVQACGAGPEQGGTDHLVHFTNSSGGDVGAGEYEWECVEL